MCVDGSYEIVAKKRCEFEEELNSLFSLLLSYNLLEHNGLLTERKRERDKKNFGKLDGLIFFPFYRLYSYNM